MKLPTLVQVAKSTAEFERYEDGALWYTAKYIEEPLNETGRLGRFTFPVPVDDSGDGSFLPQMKGVQLLRWARKHLDYLKRSSETEDEPTCGAV